MNLCPDWDLKGSTFYFLHILILFAKNIALIQVNIWKCCQGMLEWEGPIIKHCLLLQQHTTWKSQYLQLLHYFPANYDAEYDTLVKNCLVKKVDSKNRLLFDTKLLLETQQTLGQDFAFSMLLLWKICQ